MTSTLLRASIEGGLLVAAVWLLTRTLTLSAATRTMLWWCAAAKFVLALAWTTPLQLPILPTSAEPALSQPNASAAGASPVDVFSRVASRVGPRVSSRVATRLAPGEGFNAAATEFFDALRKWKSFALIGWVTGLLLISFVALRRWRETAALVRASQPADDDVRRRAADLCARLKLARVPDVRVSGTIETPLVTRFVRPVVLLPAGRFGTLSDRQQEMALCHELAHLKRADLWLGCVPALAERLFFFHPLVHLTSREYSLAREAACDAAVVETLDAPPREYGSLLLALGVSRPQTGAAAGAAWSFQHLKRRIAMLQELPSRSTRSRLAAAGAIGLALVALIPLRLVARPAAAGSRVIGRSSASELARPARQRGHVAAEPDPALPALAAIEQDTTKAPGKNEPELRFVLLREDNQSTMSGSPGDLDRARRLQRNGEPLMWFRYDGREYVVRNREFVEQAAEAWSEMFHDMFDDDMGELIGKHAEALAAQAALIAEPAAEIAGQLAGQIAGFAVDKAMDALSGLPALAPALGQLAELERLKDLPRIDVEINGKELEGVQRSIEKAVREATESAREIEGEVRRQIDRDWRRDLDLHREQIRDLQDRLRDLERPMRDMREPLKELEQPMKEIGRHFGSFGQEIGDRTRRATDEMREIIRRAIASGQAQPVK